LTTPDKRPKRPGALVLGTGLTVLGVIRSLGRQGVPVFCAERQPDFVARSRWCRHLPDVASPTPDNLADWLDHQPLRPAVLIPCSDHWVSAVTSLPDSYGESFPRSLPPAGAVATLTDKGAFASLLERLDIPRPITMPLRSAADLDSVSDDRFADSFLKPCDSQAFGRKYRVKAFRVSSRDDAAAKLAQASADRLELLFQEYIPGPPSDHFFVDGFVDRFGMVKGLFARRRLRMYPPDFGNSCYMRPVALAEVEEAVASVQKLLSAVSYRGIFSAEFKLDRRDGRYKIIEVNARPWWFIGFAADCSVDTAVMAYLDALEQEVP